MPDDGSYWTSRSGRMPTVTKSGRDLTPFYHDPDKRSENEAYRRLESSRQGNIRYGTQDYSRDNPYHGWTRALQDQYRTVRTMSRSYPRNNRRNGDR